MIPIRSRKYELDKGYEDLLNRIKLQVESSDDLYNSVYSSHPGETTKAWVGTIDSARGTFEIVRPNPSAILPLRFLEGNFFTMIVEGRITGNDHKTRIEVSYTLGIQATLIMVLIIALPLLILPQVISSGEWEKNVNAFIFFGATSFFIPVLVLIAQLNHTENMIFDFLGIRTIRKKSSK